MTSSAYGWTLIARFSNNDTKRWMNDTGFWWYDRNSSFGITTDSSHNADMISPAFWLVRGNELKITRSDDHQHVALLQTTGNCLGGQTFRSKITAFGNFRNGAIWTSNPFWVIVLFSMAVSTQQLVASKRQHAKETFKVLMQSASGVTGGQVMER